jgi:hypothetical protein
VLLLLLLLLLFCPAVLLLLLLLRPVISPFLTPGRKPWQVLSDLGYPIDPEGMHQVGAHMRCLQGSRDGRGSLP